VAKAGIRIQSAIKQKRPFSSVEHAVAVAIQRVAGLHRDALAEQLRPSGLSLTQFNVLRILRGAGDQGLPCGEIVERLVTRDPDMTRLLDRLDRQGLVTRVRAVSDRRVVTARITSSGLDALAALDEPVEAVHRKQLEGMSRSRLTALLDLLEDAAGALDRGARADTSRTRGQAAAPARDRTRRGIGSFNT
jgi:DNA-binding MarR family transcriptional regulator